VTGGYYGVDAIEYSTVEVGGDVTGGYYGVHAVFGANVTVHGNVTSDDIGAHAEFGANVTVHGNVTSDSIGAYATNYSKGFGYGDGGKITIDGVITVPDNGMYIVVDGRYKTQNDDTTPTTKRGYREYTDGSDSPSYVWVKDTRPEKPVPPVLNLDKIPSFQHADRWWDDFGIFCFGANTTGSEYPQFGNGMYFVAFADGFWDHYECAVVGFGTPSNPDMITITYTANGAILEDSRNGFTSDQYCTQFANAGFTYDCKYSHNKAKNVFFGNMDVRVCDNPHGSGGMQAHLITVY